MNECSVAPPLVASWESTLRCNMRCRHCGLVAGNDAAACRGKELTGPESLDMFRGLRDLGVQRLVISGGEFTLRHDWQELLSAALALFGDVRLISNGWMGEELLRKLETQRYAKERLTLSVSLDGMERMHDRIRQAGSFRRVIEILRAGSFIRRSVLTTVMNANFGELDAVFTLLAGTFTAAWAIQLGLPEGRMEWSEFIGPKRTKMLAEQIVKWQARAAGFMEVIPDDCFGYAHPMRCSHPWEGCPAARKLITVLANGDVTGCPTTFDEPCGNIRRAGIAEIWSGEAFGRFRDDVPRCARCDNRICHGGCRAVQKAVGEQMCFQ